MYPPPILNQVYPPKIRLTFEESGFCPHSQVPQLTDKQITSGIVLQDGSCWRSLSYRNQPIDLQSKSMNWFLYDKDIRHERVKDGS